LKKGFPCQALPPRTQTCDIQLAGRRAGIHVQEVWLLTTKQVQHESAYMTYMIKMMASGLGV
jgi:hypothetical protein